MGTYDGMPVDRNFNIVWVDAGHGVGIEVTESNQTVEYSGDEVRINLE
jgi:hypothetical protein